jgi:hypothetical protein
VTMRRQARGRRRACSAGRRGRAVEWRAGFLAAALLVAQPAIGCAQQATTLKGSPVQVTPYVSEPGVPAFQIPLGTPTPPATNGTTGDGTSDDGSQGSSALSTMLATSWGAQASAVSQSLGVNASALAATCVIESGCQNTGSNGVSSATGPFQMLPSTFSAMYAAAINDNPSLASTTTGNINDPGSEAAAAAEYLKQAAQQLENAGISNPTVVDTRGYYNFGPAAGVDIATANPSETMSAAMPGVSLATQSRNGVTSGETVAQWQAAAAAKIGNAANQSILS